MSVDTSSLEQVCCPKCYAKLSQFDNQLQCNQSSCRQSYPLVDNVPVLLDEKRSLFTFDDFFTAPKDISGTSS